MSIKIFRRKIFVSVPKISEGEFFPVALISGSEKVHGQEGGGEYQAFPSNFFCLSPEKVRR